MKEKSEVRIVNLEPLRVASVYAYGEGPEHAAAAKLIAWAGPLGWLETEGVHRIFGFDNPGPSPGSPNYGYEYWVSIGPALIPTGDIKVKNCEGGLYAVTRCCVNHDADRVIPAAWKKLAAWCENSRYEPGPHQWLEEHLGPFRAADDFTLDLYLPIRE